MKGGINTGDFRDRRPVWYAKYLVCMAAAVISGGYVYHVPADRLLFPVLVMAALLWVTFYLFSQHPHASHR